MAKLREVNAKTFPVRLDLDGLIVKLELRPYKGGYQEAEAWQRKLEDTEDRAETILLVRERFAGIVPVWDVDGPLHAETCVVLTEGKEPSYGEDGSCTLCGETEIRVPLTADGLRRADVNPNFLTTLLMRGFEAFNEKKLKSGRY